MQTVKIKSSVKTLEVEWANGKKDVYSFRTGDKDSLMMWYRKAKDLESFEKRVTDESAIEELYKLEEELISMILGAKGWREIWKKAGGEVFAVFAIVNALSSLVKEGVEESMKILKANG